MKNLINYFSPPRRKVAKKNLVSLCLGGLLIISCSKKKEKVPENILPKDKMIQVMVDVHIAEAAIQSKYLNLNDSTKKIAAGYYRNLLEKNKISEQQFRESFLYYSKHLELFNKIYEDVISELGKKQAENSNH